MYKSFEIAHSCEWLSLRELKLTIGNKKSNGKSETEKIKTLQHHTLGFKLLHT